MDRIHMAGYDAVHPSDFIYEVAGPHDHYLLILTNTPARFWQNGTMRQVPPHHAALFSPDTSIRYGADGQPYGNDWLIFSSDEAYVRDFPFIGTPFPVLDPEYCHNLFQLLTWEHRQSGYEAVLSQLMSILFRKLEADIRVNENGGYEPALLTIRKNIRAHPQENRTVARMAAELHISEGYMQLLCRRRFGISCMEDVIQSRLRLARDYLCHTHMSVSAIAALCGYNNVEHFSRQFRRGCGMTPGSYRKSAAGDPSRTPEK